MDSIFCVRIGVVSLSIGLAACTSLRPTSAMLTYETDPEGAALFESGQPIGVAPVTRTYGADPAAADIRTPEVSAVWPSGAKTRFWTLLAPGADRVATLRRPEGAPGLQADLDNAKPYAAQKEREARRNKEAVLREIARDSVRCRDQVARTGRPNNDCF
jgi:hypothetical protein